MKLQAKSFHFNGNIKGFPQQTQKLDSPYKSPSNTDSEGVKPVLFKNLRTMNKYILDFIRLCNKNYRLL